eukprot:scaffold35644_cov112-Isochrysis_galbana.AAC.3
MACGRGRLDGRSPPTPPAKTGAAQASRRPCRRPRLRENSFHLPLGRVRTGRLVLEYYACIGGMIDCLSAPLRLRRAPAAPIAPTRWC